MKNSAAETSSDSRGFFENLPHLASPADTFDLTKYRPAPDDWFLAVTDVVNSSQVIASGRHKQVNIVAAAAIAALKNLCAPIPIPILFGGDGAVIMVPACHADDARLALARLRGFAARDFGLTLRVGLIGMAALRQHGTDVLVGHYLPSPGNSFGVFSGGGVGLVEAAIKAVAPTALGRLAAIPEALDDSAPVDMSGLSCRWNALTSSRGKMVTLIIHGAKAPRELYARVMALAAGDGDPRPARPATLKASWPPKGFLLEARVNRGRRPLALAAAQVLTRTLVGALVFARGRPVGRFDPAHYLEEIATNTDFCKHDDTMCLVIDCSAKAIDAIRQVLDEHEGEGALRYGMHLSETALMTCLVSSATDNLHVHFIDGGDGGYTSASKRLKDLSSRAA